MKRNLWNATHRCLKCDRAMRKKYLIVDGTKLRGWECKKCDETVLHPEDAQKMLVLSKLKRGLPVKIGELGNSLIVRIPVEMVELYELRKGGEILMKAESDRRIGLDLSELS